MDNQHRKITGYRELEQGEIDLVNEVKDIGPTLEGMITRVLDHGGSPREAEHARMQLKDGLMWLTRSITKPEFF